MRQSHLNDLKRTTVAFPAELNGCGHNSIPISECF